MRVNFYNATRSRWDEQREFETVDGIEAWCQELANRWGELVHAYEPGQEGGEYICSADPKLEMEEQE